MLTTATVAVFSHCSSTATVAVFPYCSKTAQHRSILYVDNTSRTSSSTRISTFYASSSEPLETEKGTENTLHVHRKEYCT